MERLRGSQKHAVVLVEHDYQQNKITHKSHFLKLNSIIFRLQLGTCVFTGNPLTSPKKREKESLFSCHQNKCPQKTDTLMYRFITRAITMDQGLSYNHGNNLS